MNHRAWFGLLTIFLEAYFIHEYYEDLTIDSRMKQSRMNQTIKDEAIKSIILRVGSYSRVLRVGSLKLQLVAFIPGF